MKRNAEEILAAERARAAAIVARDVEALATWLHDDLAYVHATGVRHDRAQLLRFIAEGPRFLGVELQDPCIRSFGDVGLVAGELRMTLLRSGDATPFNARSWASEVWRREGGRHWRLLHFQSTRVSE